MPNCIKKVDKWGGGFNKKIWGCFSGKGLGNLEIIEGKMNGAMYKEILNKNLFESVNNMEIEEEYIFQQDNDSKHISRVVKDFLLEKEVNILPWPTNSQDLNPIENLWAHSKSKVSQRLPFPRGQLEDIIKEEWNFIREKEQAMLHNLIKSMPNRLKEVSDQKGYGINY